jgi:hypothetical protein
MHIRLYSYDVFGNDLESAADDRDRNPDFSAGDCRISDEINYRSTPRKKNAFHP